MKYILEREKLLGFPYIYVVFFLNRVGLMWYPILNIYSSIGWELSVSCLFIYLLLCYFFFLSIPVDTIGHFIISPALNQVMQWIGWNLQLRDIRCFTGHWLNRMYSMKYSVKWNTLKVIDHLFFPVIWNTLLKEMNYWFCPISIYPFLSLTK